MATLFAAVAARVEIPATGPATAPPLGLFLPSILPPGGPSVQFDSRPTVASGESPATASYAFDCVPVAGYQYHHGESVWSLLAEGQALDLTREPGNSHDAGAIRVDWHGLKLGYVPRARNTALANLMDQGVMARARIAGLANTADPWERISMEIEIEVGV